MKPPRKYRMGVFKHTSDKGRTSWTAYSRYVNPEWDGFVGWFEVEASSWREAVKLAIAKAKEATS